MSFISEIFGYLLNALYQVFNNYGIAIIVFSVILRIILIPITIKQQASMKKSVALQEEMKEIQRKYQNNPEKLNQETINLYKREKMSPFSGCLSSILQIIIILSVFWLVSQPLTYMKRLNEPYKADSEDVNEQANVIDYYKNEIQKENTEQRASYMEIEIINRYGETDERVNLNMDFLGLDLSKVPSSNLDDWTVYIIPALYVISSMISIRLSTGVSKNKKKKLIGDGKEKKDSPEEIDPMESMNKNMSYMMPIMSVFIAFIAPLGLALYWLVSNILMTVERIIVNKFMEHKEEKENA